MAKIFNQAGSKERLFEMFENVNKLKMNESFEVHYSDGIRQAKNFNNFDQALQFSKETIANNPKLKNINIYKNDGGFHSTSQEDKLVSWWGDGSYWDNMSKENPELLDKKIETVEVEEVRESTNNDGSSSKTVGIIKPSYNNFEARIETIHYDHSPKNPSLPVIDGTYNGKPTQKFVNSIEDGVEHIRSFGFDGDIEIHNNRGETINRIKGVSESFDSPAEKDERYLNKVGDEKAYDEQPNKYDDGVRYPVEKELKVKDDSLEGLRGDDAPLKEDRGEKEKEMVMGRYSDAFKEFLKRTYGVDTTADLSPADRRELQQLVNYEDKKELPTRKIDVEPEATDDDRKAYIQRDRDQLEYLAKNINSIKDLDSFYQIHGRYQDETGEKMNHPMAILSSISQLHPYTDLRKKLKPIEDILIDNTDNPEKARKIVAREGEMDESIWSGIKQVGKDVGSAVKKSYYKGRMNNNIDKLEKKATKFGIEFAKLIDKVNAHAKKSGLELADARSIGQTILNSIVSNAKKDPTKGVSLSGYRKEGIREDEELEGGLGDGAEPMQFDSRQIMKGMEIEMEHTDDPKVALEIAMDHLTEIPDYYDRLEDMEQEADGDEIERKEDGDDRTADSMLYPSEHWTDHYEVKRIGNE